MKHYKYKTDLIPLLEVLSNPSYDNATIFKKFIIEISKYEYSEKVEHSHQLWARFCEVSLQVIQDAIDRERFEIVILMEKAWETQSSIFRLYVSNQFGDEESEYNRIISLYDEIDVIYKREKTAIAQNYERRI